MTALVEINGGVADVTSGDVYVLDWDNLADDEDYARGVIEIIRFSLNIPEEDQRRIIDTIKTIWPRAVTADYQVTISSTFAATSKENAISEMIDWLDEHLRDPDLEFTIESDVEITIVRGDEAE